MHTKRILAGTLLASFLGACSGAHSTGSGPLPAMPSSAVSALQTLGAPSARRTARLMLKLSIPRRRKGRPDYISASTQSIRIQEGPKILGTFNTTPTTKGCVQQSGSTLCTYSMGAIPGKQLFKVSTYDGQNAGGNVVARGNVTQTIAAGKVNRIPLTLNGVPANLTLVLDNSSPTQGTPSTLHLTVNATDADGNIILAPGNYATPISLVDSDQSGATVLGASTVTSPSANVVAIAYNGSAVTATFTASATGVTNVTAGLKSVLPHSGFIGGVWAAIPGSPSVQYYNSSTSPSAVLSATGLSNVTATAVDGQGRVIAGDASGDIDVWPINAVNVATPAQSINGAGNITALAWDPIGGRIIYSAANSSSFCVVAANASGAAGGVSTCYSSPTYPLSPSISGLAVDSNTGNLYVANATPVATTNTTNGTYCGGFSCISVLVFTLSSGGAYNFDHILDIQDCHSGYWNNVGQIAFDPSVVNPDSSRGVLWVADETPGYDIVGGFYSSDTGCNEIGPGDITGDGSSLAQPATVAWDGASGLWIGDQSTGWLQHWTNIYVTPSVPTGNSFHLAGSPANIAVFNVYTPPTLRRRR